MARGKPDYHNSVVIEGYNGATYQPVLVDGSGQMYNIVKGSDAGTFRTIAVDGSGRMMSRMTGVYNDIEVKDLAVDTSGKIIGLLQGDDAGTLRNIYVDGSGKMVARIQGIGAGDEPLLTIEDGGDTTKVVNWDEYFDGMFPLGTDDYVKEGTNAIKLRIDASKTGADEAWWLNETSFYHVDTYQHDWIYIWLFVSDTTPIATPGASLIYYIGSDDGNYINFYFEKSDLQQGWNLLKCDLDNPSSADGTIDWTAINYQLFVIYEVDDNTQDFFLVLDTIMFVRPNSSAGTLIDVATDKDGLMLGKMIGDYAGLPKPIASDKYGFLRNNVAAQALWTQVANKNRGKITHVYVNHNHLGAEYYEMCDIEGPGIILGGILRHTALVTHKLCNILITVDGLLLREANFYTLNSFKATSPWQIIPNLIEFDDTNFVYIVGIPHGITFETQFKIVFNEKIGAADDSRLYLYYALL